MGRRGSDDLQWKKVKTEVKARDNGHDRILYVVTAQEMFILRKNAGPLINTLDPAHFLPVGRYPELCYDKDNIITLNRYSHSMLDSMHDPITGKPINKEMQTKWWIKLLKANPSQYNSLSKKNLLNEEE